MLLGTHGWFCNQSFTDPKVQLCFVNFLCEIYDSFTKETQTHLVPFSFFISYLLMYLYKDRYCLIMELTNFQDSLKVIFHGCDI